MQKKAEKILVFILVGFLIITLTSNKSIYDVQQDVFEPPKGAPVYSSLIIRPNEDYVNPFWDSSPISDKINDSIVYPTAGGDSDFVVGNTVGDWCEVRMGDISLESNQVVTRIKIYARGCQSSPGLSTQNVEFYWRIGTLGTYSAEEHLQFEGTSFYWQSTPFWDTLEMNETEINALQIRMEIGGTIHQQPGQSISVMYVVLTVKTNNPPTVNLTYPTGGETLYDSALVEWSYNDPDGDSVSFDLSYRIDGGTWTPIITNIINQANYLWNLSSFSQTYTDVEFLIEASDGDTGYANDASNSFVIKVNRNPTVNIISPNGGEVLRDDTLIQWTYNDVDADAVFFNISYQIDGSAWVPIVNELENQTSYLWDLSDFSQTYYNMSVKIIAYHAFGGYSEDNSSDYFTFTIREYQPPLDFIPLLILGVSITSLGLIGTGLFIRKRRLKSKQAIN